MAKAQPWDQLTEEQKADLLNKTKETVLKEVEKLRKETEEKPKTGS